MLANNNLFWTLRQAYGQKNNLYKNLFKILPVMAFGMQWILITIKINVRRIVYNTVLTIVNTSVNIS